MYWIYFSLVVILGLAFGSFLNVCIYRLPKKLSIIYPNSFCPNCKSKIRIVDNIPILSYLRLRGKCRNCHQKISIRYLLVELLNAVLWATCFLLFSSNLVLFFSSIIFCSILIIITFIDLENKIIFDRFNLIILFLGAILCIFSHDVIWYDRLIGLGFGFLFFLIVYILGKVLFNKDVLGQGDIKLVASIGLFLGWQNLIVMFLFAFLSSAMVLLPISIKKNLQNHEFPFAPFLAFGAILSLFVAKKIIIFYLGLF